jgi:hypothetical protein
MIMRSVRVYETRVQEHWVKLALQTPLKFITTGVVSAFCAQNLVRISWTEKGGTCEIDGGIATNGPMGGEHSNGEEDVLT